MESTPLFNERMNRIRQAVALETPDRVPVVLEYATFAALVTNTPLPEFLLSLEKSVEIMIDAYRRVGEVAQADAMNYGRFSPYNLCYAWLSKVKEIPGDHICIMGDVPASMLAMDDPDTVYRYSSRLVRKLGPEGFILHPGCDIPENAKLENVQAMVAAAVEG